MHATVTRDEILEVLHTNIRKVVEDAHELDAISQTHSLKDDFGADSLEIVEVVSRSMKDLRIKVPRTELAKASNIGELADIFERFAAA
jgi:acyl carrier protein/polyketide biosynthesis acyl carrier protein